MTNRPLWYTDTRNCAKLIAQQLTGMANDRGWMFRPY